MQSSIDVHKIKKAVFNAIPVNLKTYTLPRETDIYLEKILEAFLVEMGQEKIKEPLQYCLKELSVNAKKANTRVNKGRSFSDMSYLRNLWQESEENGQFHQSDYTTECYYSVTILLLFRDLLLIRDCS